MKEEEIDALVFAALSNGVGKELHGWLVNNFLLNPKQTVNPNEALYAHAQGGLVSMLNTRYARHLERMNGKRKSGDDPATGRYGSGARVGKHFKPEQQT